MHQYDIQTPLIKYKFVFGKLFFLKKRNIFIY